VIQEISKNYQHIFVDYNYMLGIMLVLVMVRIGVAGLRGAWRPEWARPSSHAARGLGCHGWVEMHVSVTAKC
jgi:hypothetical protein